MTLSITAGIYSQSYAARQPEGSSKGESDVQHSAKQGAVLASTLLRIFHEKKPPMGKDNLNLALFTLTEKVIVPVHFGDVGMGMQLKVQVPVYLFLTIYRSGLVTFSARLRDMQHYMRQHVWEVHKGQMRSRAGSPHVPLAGILLQYHKILPDETTRIIAIQSGEALAGCVQDGRLDQTARFECYFSEGHRYNWMPQPSVFL